jgi:hypothetical protein
MARDPASTLGFHTLSRAPECIPSYDLWADNC